MYLKLDLTPETYDFKLNYKDKLFLGGSCFTENIGAILTQHYLQTTINPFGIAYQPLAIFNALHRIATLNYFSDEELYLHNELWHSWHHHSKFNHPNKEKTLEQINNTLQNAHQSLLESNTIILTLGTAIVYQHINSQQYVANCHKVPANEFTKLQLSTNEIVTAFRTVYAIIKAILPSIKFIFTVSPVRHWRDGLIQNNRSKSVLILSIQELLSLPDVYYFPAYELVIDDLRDYRFYKQDLCHPNEMATAYVWKYFKETIYDDTSISYFKEIEAFNKLLTHEILFPSTMEAQKLKAKIAQQKEHLSQKYTITFH